jgi:hypothetical protein
MSDEPRTDPLHAWLEAVRGLAPVDRLQALQEDLVRGLFLPVDVLAQAAGQLADPLREQAQAFERASKAFAEIASLLRQQADLLDAAGGAVRAPTDALKRVVGASTPAKRAPAKRSTTTRSTTKRSSAGKRSASRRSR